MYVCYYHSLPAASWLACFSALIQTACFDDTESVAEVVLLPLFKDWEYDGASHLVVIELFS